MTQAGVQSLVIDTLRAPAEAARQLLQLRLPREWLWMALALMCVLNAIVYSLSLHLGPPQDPAAMAMIPPAFRSPVLFTMFLFGGLVITVFTLTWIGKALGGTAGLGEILLLITWLQVMRLILQVVVVVLTLVAPSLAVLVIFAASLWGIYILAAFLNVAHGFDSLFKALGVMLIGFLAIGIGLTLILGAIGAVIVGGGAHV